VYQVRRENADRGPVVLRVTADTNVLVSAIIYPRGNPRRILQMALAGEINLTVSEPILDEMADVLARKFDATPREIEEASAIIKQAARTVKPAVRLEVILRKTPTTTASSNASDGGF
jgi:putative PIN family toxin of toxin-antitoxin system